MTEDRDSNPRKVNVWLERRIIMKEEGRDSGKAILRWGRWQDK